MFEVKWLILRVWFFVIIRLGQVKKKGFFICFGFVNRFWGEESLLVVAALVWIRVRICVSVIRGKVIKWCFI